MYGQGWVVSNADLQKIRKQEKRREEQKKQVEEQRKQGQDKVNNAGLRQFGTSTSEALDNLFKNETVGLQTRDEFVQKRATLQDRIEEEQKRQAREAEESELKRREQRRKEKARKAAQRAKLSFLGGDDEQEQEEEEQEQQEAGPSPPGKQQAASSGDEGPASKRPKYGKFGKDPGVATSFLPDKDREREEEELRRALKKEWHASQARIKAEPLEITYSYWDGQGHRRKVNVKKGDSIGTFLKAVREQLGPEFRELRTASLDNLLYIKEDIILQHHLTFYDLIINKARGKSGPLFNFSVHEEVRLVNDATVEKEDSHAGKVVERHWYDKNKHIFPASRWEAFDPDKVYQKYTVKGS